MAYASNGPYLPSSFSSPYADLPPASSYSQHGDAPYDYEYGPTQEFLPTPREILNSSALSYLVAPLPTVASLSTVLSSVQQPSYDPAGQVAWCRDVLSLVERSQRLASPPSNPSRIDDPALQRLIDIALSMLVKLASRRKPMQTYVPGYVAEAMYLCATCEASGAYPQHIPYNPKNAFSRCEQAAKAGHSAAWFNLGSDFEKFGNIPHAKECFERGASHNAPNCLYRIGLAHLTGKLGLPVSPETAIHVLKQAAALATVDVPEPAYAYALLLLDEFPDIHLHPSIFAPHLPAESTPYSEARRQLEHAAYLHHAPAQNRLGRAFELAEQDFPFEAVLSVQYYALASRQGDADADMALSKWFLCGCEDVFDKDEDLAYTYAEQAARKGLPSAQFAMGYYAEVGIGIPQDIAAARRWYALASQQGNADAPERLQALSRAQSLSRQEHEELTKTQLVRKRTQARMRSQGTDRPPVPPLPPATMPESAPAPWSPPSAQIAPLRIRKSAQARVQNGSPGPDTYANAPAPQTYGHATPTRGASPAPAPRPEPQYQHRKTNSVGAPASAQSRAYSPAPSNSRSNSSPLLGPSGGRPDPRSLGTSSSQPQMQAQSSYRGPQTFQEMGIPTQAPSDERDCIIM